jgi:hypothetical protein
MNESVNGTSQCTSKTVLSVLFHSVPLKKEDPSYPQQQQSRCVELVDVCWRMLTYADVCGAGDGGCVELVAVTVTLDRPFLSHTKTKRQSRSGSLQAASEGQHLIKTHL